MTEPAGFKITDRWRRPGFLLAPLGWVQDRLAKAFEAEPTLVEMAATIRRTRPSASHSICDSATCRIACSPTTTRSLRPDATPGMPSSPRLAALNPSAHSRIS